MRILQATIRYSPAIGGVEEYVKNISERLALKKYQVKVLTSDLIKYTPATRIKQEKNLINGVEVIRAKTLSWRLGNYALMPALALKFIQQQPEVIHAHCYMYFPFDAAVLTAYFKKIPLVINPYLAQLGRPSLFGKAYRHSLGALAMAANAVVAISEYEKNLIREWGYRPKRIEIIPPGINFSEFEKEYVNIFEKIGLGEKKIILFTGRLDFNKGVDLLINALPQILSEIPQAHLVMIGPDCGYKDALINLAKTMGVSKKITFLGQVEREDVIAAMKHASVFVLASRYEAFGIVLIEAMAARLPVVATNHSAIPGIINNGVDGLLFPLDNYVQLAQKIIELIKNGKLRSQIIETAWQKVKNNFDWDKTAKKTEELYLSLKDEKVYFKL